MEVEVRVHRVRRRRAEPPVLVTSRPLNFRNWVIYAGLTLFTAALMFEGHLNHKPRYSALPALAEVTDVRSAISSTPDSIQVVVSWDLTLSTPAGRPDSVLIKVIPATGTDSLIAVRSATVFTDTTLLATPASGQALTGSSCVAARHPAQPLTEICTPWQYVRPASIPLASVATAQRIVVEPNGLQVDPDTGGKCAEWQRTHPGESVWIAVNRAAIWNCTGANGKPTVAQFCAFMVLADGRRVKTAASAKSSYCDELFVEWTRERYS